METGGIALSAAIAVIGLGCMVLGYRLFWKGTAPQSNAAGPSDNDRLSFRDIIPGSLLAVIGLGLLIFSVTKGCSIAAAASDEGKAQASAQAPLP